MNGSSTPGTSGLKLTRRIVWRSRVTVTRFNFTFVARR
jgi:hypothetical protein